MSDFDGKDYPSLRRTRAALRTFTPWISWGVGTAGALLFGQQAYKLLGTGFGLGERVEIGIWALLYLGGFAVAAALVRLLLGAVEDLLDVLVDQALACRAAVLAIENELVPAARELLKKLGDLAKSAPSTPARPVDLSNLTTTDLLDQLRSAKQMGDADEVLDLRQSLLPRLSDEKRQKIDLDLADWFTRHFQRALVAGKAAIIAPALGRAVEAMQDIEEMEALRRALPMVRQSAGLCVECGRPYRGHDLTCPACRSDEAP